MSATNVFENGLLSLIFENANYANVGDATGLRGSTTAGVFWISLHTADPGEAGTQTTSEATYTGYARISVNRDSAGWTVTTGTVTNDAAITFGLCTAGSNSITHFGIGSNQTTAGNLFLKGALTATLAVSAGITPSFAIGQLSVSRTNPMADNVGYTPGAGATVAADDIGGILYQRNRKIALGADGTR